jgi:ubiquinone/menaquinone biosynthesis C-methylase UbiE
LAIISLMHDSLYRLFVNPYHRLTAAGLRPGQVVLEVGCGPGFFTIPAAEIVGVKGHLYALDINPAAVAHVKQKVEAKGLTNTEVMHANAANAGLPNESIDLAFIFGVLLSPEDLDAVLLEMHRILKEGGVLAAQRSSRPETQLSRFTKDHLFRLVTTDSRIYRFGKEPDQIRR